jgi:hypothetical protein
MQAMATKAALQEQLLMQANQLQQAPLPMLSPAML